MLGGTFVVVFLLYLGTRFDGVEGQLTARLNICPVQGLNRTIQPGYPLIQCFPFYQTGACCERHEEQAVFNKFGELRLTAASDTCMSLMSNLLCYICSPDQANWYFNNKVTVCGEFCDTLWAHCSGARFGNIGLGSLYGNGRDFCQREGFTIQGTTNRNCYNTHPSLTGTGGAATLKISGMFITSFAIFITSILMHA